MELNNHSQQDSIFRIEITLDEDFKIQFQKLKRKYGEEMFAIEGLSKENLNITNFFDKFMNSDNVANASIDDNSNVTEKNISIMLSESRKPYNKLLSHNKIYIELKQNFDKETADKWLEWQINGALYSHDSHESTLKPYCFAFSLKPIVEKGLYFIDTMKALPAKHLDTFNHHILEFVSYATNMQSGAVGIPDYLIYAYYYWKKDVETGYVNDAEIYKKQKWQEILFNLNQPYLKGGEQCVTEDTEVLTPQGFKKYSNLNIGDDIYTWNNGSLNIQKVNKVNIYDFDGEMHRYSGRDYFQQVTPEHRLLYKKYNSIDKYELKKSKYMIDKKSPIYMPVAMLENNIGGIDLSDDMIELLTMILTDGNISKEEDKDRIRIYKSPKRWGNKRITTLLNNLNIQYTITSKDSKWKGAIGVEGETDKTYTINSYNISADDSRRLIKFLNHTKKDIPDLFLNMNKKQAELFITTWGKMDGYIRNARDMKLQCDNYDIADKLQHIMFLAGYGSRITERLIGKNKTPTIYVIRYTEINKTSTKKERVYYKGKVWCPTTDDGIVVFRQQGRVFISGNSAYTNFSILDRDHIIGLLGEESYPDGSLIIDHLEDIIQYQKDFLDYEKELRHEKFFTFPVISASLLFQDGKYVDEDMARFVCKHNMEWQDVNIYNAKEVDGMSSCCRLVSSLKDINESNEEDLQGHFNSIGGSSISIGSTKVNTINLVRIALESKGNFEEYKKILKDRVDISHKYLFVQRKVLEKNIKKGLLPLYTYELLDMKRQFSTIGITGVFEAIKLLGGISENSTGVYYNENGFHMAEEILDIISEMNKTTKKLYGYNANQEQIPSESCAIKICKKDKLIFGENCIDTYIYGNQWIPLNQHCDVMERIKTSSLLDEKCGGGVMLHINLAEPFKDEEQAWLLMNKLAKEGIIYFSFVLKINVCNQDHSFHDNRCPICGGIVVDSYIKIVGYLVKTSSYKAERSTEMNERVFYEI